MRIIDSEVDYYDFAGGRDETIVYDRRGRSSLEVPESLGMPECSRFSGWPDICEAEPFFAIVGGYGVPGVRITMGDPDRPDVAHVYDADLAVSETLKIAEAANRGRFSMRPARALAEDFRAHVERGTVDLCSVCVPLRVVTGAFIRKSAGPYLSAADTGSVYVPVRLLDLGLDEALPAHEAHMLVSRFVGGVLTEMRETSTLSDRSRILKAGFDLKTSFRKQPQAS